MCTQDLITYRCMHTSKGEVHPCEAKQEYPRDNCQFQAFRRLELPQQCKKCTTKSVGRRTDSDWSYNKNEEYQRRARSRWDENAEERKKENWPYIGTNFTVQYPQAYQPGRGRLNILQSYTSRAEEIDLIDLDAAEAGDWKDSKETHKENRDEGLGISGTITNFEVKLSEDAKPEIHRAVAIHRFSSELGEDCFFEVGDIISIFHSVDKKCWWGVNLKTLAKGLLPKSDVAILNSSLLRAQRVEKEAKEESAAGESFPFPPYDNSVGEALLDYINN